MDAEPPPAGGIRLAWLLLAALLVGGLAGLIGSLFRLALGRADDLRGALVAWSRGHPAWGWLLPVAGAALGVALARWLVRRFAADASGSGVPQVKGVVQGGPFHGSFVLPVKFVGGLSALGAGLALGREGPIVQMGSAVAQWVGRRLRMPAAELRVLSAAGAGAGLAAAFGAPLAGAVFVLEELAHRLRVRAALASFAAAGVAIAVMYQLLGATPELALPPLPTPGPWHFAFDLGFGLGVGALGVAYNRLILAGLDVGGRLRRVRPELRAAAIGALVGLLAWFAPDLVGGGEQLLQRLLAGREGMGFLLIVLGVRFVLGPLSYAAETPGGLFAPLLLLGGVMGQLYGGLVHAIAPAAAPSAVDFAVVGMAAFFAATVRAPITGTALVVEMTGTANLFVPMLVAIAGALLVPILLGDEPIYDALRQRQPGRGP